MAKEGLKNITTAFDRSEKQADIPRVPYTPEEVAYRSFWLRRIQDAYDQREDQHIEFDDNSYSGQYQENLKAANSYNPPRTNLEDTRIVTGVTQEKETTLLSAVLNFNFEANISAFLQNDVRVVEAGEVMEDLVRKSRELEEYDSNRRLIYKELFDQGTCFVEEIKREDITFDKKFRDNDWKMGGVDAKKIRWDVKIKKSLPKCEVNLLSGLDVYLGNFREFDMARQPYIAVRSVITYDQAQALYGDWDRFKYVPRQIETMTNELEQSDTHEYRNWTLLEVQADTVEVMKVQDTVNNDYNIYLNGVQMLPVGFPLTYISPSGSYTVSKGDVNPISKFCAYSKSHPSNTKVDQAVLDEILRLLLLKMKKSFMPPMANNTNRALSRKVLWPGSVTKNIDPAKLQIIGDASGPSVAEFNMFQLVKDIINEKSLDPSFTGSSTGGSVTATEILQRKQQQMLKLGQTIIGVILLEKNIAERRIHNILSNWTTPIDTRVDEVRNTLVDVYRNLSIDTSFKDTGEKGERIVSFDPEMAEKFSSPSGAEMLKRVEDSVRMERGRNVRFSFISPEAIRNSGIVWKVNIVPTEKNQSELDRILFMQNVTEAANIFGPQSLNMSYLKQRFAQITKEDPEKFFTQEQQQPQEQIQEMSQGRSSAITRDVMNAVSPAVRAPGARTLAMS